MLAVKKIKWIFVFIGIMQTILYVEHGHAELKRGTHFFATIQTKLHCPRLNKFDNNFVAVRVYRSAKDTYFVYDENASGFKFPKSGRALNRLRRKQYNVAARYRRSNRDHDLALEYYTKDGTYLFRYHVRVARNGSSCRISRCNFLNKNRLFLKYCDLGCRPEYCEIRSGSPY